MWSLQDAVLEIRSHLRRCSYTKPRGFTAGKFQSGGGGGVRWGGGGERAGWGWGQGWWGWREWEAVLHLLQTSWNVFQTPCLKSCAYRVQRSEESSKDWREASNLPLHYNNTHRCSLLQGNRQERRGGGRKGGKEVRDGVKKTKNKNKQQKNVKEMGGGGDGFVSLRWSCMLSPGVFLPASV